jgi:Zn-dependent peptidase ImmA (M78 family)
MDDDFDKPQIKLARDVARKLLKNAQIKTYPIKLKDIAKQVPDLYIDGQELEDEISGMQGTYKGVSFIRYNANHSTKRNRFTVAHELGHAMLGHTTECNRSSIVTKDPREVEANQFAAELLTPLELLKQAILKLKTVDELAKGFWVSKDSMSWRVLETGLYNRLTSWE